MSDILFEMGVILTLIVLNGVLSMAELAIVASRKARLRQMADEGDGGASEALALADDPNRLLPTVQVGITLVGTLAGAFGGATLAEQLAEALAEVRWLRPYAEGLAVGLVVVGITYVTLVLGELVPKRLAISRPEALASRLARPVGMLSRATVPVVTILGRSTDLLLRLVRVGASPPEPVTEEDLHQLIGEGARTGVFEPDEHDMLRRALRLADRPAATMMTPRMSIQWIDANLPAEAIRERLATSSHSRFPVCDGDLDRVLGLLDTRDLLKRHLTDRPFDLHGMLRMPLLFYEGTPGSRVLEAFRGQSSEVALVLDEYGSVAGLMTPSDLLEAIVGGLGSDVDSPREQAARRADGSWLLDGLTPREELVDLVGLRSLPEGDYRTLAGLVLNQLGRIPVATDHFDWEGHRFEVMDMDEKRVDKVLVRPLDSPRNG
jgi:putative hemolysin